MEAMFLHSDQPISPYKSHMANPRNNRALISRPFYNSLPSNFNLFHSQPCFLSSSYPPVPQQQPPLLPLPTASFHQISRRFSCPPPNRQTHKNSRNKIHQKKSKSATNSPKKDEKNPIQKAPLDVVSSTDPLGPDPKDLPKDGAKILSFVESVEEEKKVDKFSGSVVFTVSPPPSSLPLPTFSLRPKLSCNAEAAGIDAGATDNLRRLLRL